MKGTAGDGCTGEQDPRSCSAMNNAATNTYTACAPTNPTTCTLLGIFGRLDFSSAQVPSEFAAGGYEHVHLGQLDAPLDPHRANCAVNGTCCLADRVTLVH